MQGYLKFKETDEELYEMELNFEHQVLFISIVRFLVSGYLCLVVQIKKWFNIITVKEIYSGLIFILPFSNKKGGNQKQLKKCIPKVKKLMKKYQISSLVLADDLRENEIFLEKFQNNRTVERAVQILDGREMMPYLIKEIMEYILQKQGKTTELEDLYILANKDCSQYRENITFLTQYFKTINIVTPCLKSYQNLANYLSKKGNVMLTVTNNKKKSLRKARWLVNFDMASEEMKKYTIYRTATIIYLEKDNLYNTNSFDGLHICKAGIDVSQEIKDFFEKQHLIKQCPITILYESTLTNKRSFLSIREQMKKDQVKVLKLYGSRGVLSDEDYKKVG